MTSRALLALLILAVSAPLPATSRPAAAAQDVIDRGTFTLYVNEARIGEERFLIGRERGGGGGGGGGGGDGPIYRARGEQNLKLDNRTMRTSVALEATGARPRPRRYEAEISGDGSTSIVATVVSELLRLEVRSPQGLEIKEFLARGRTTILDRYVAHQYFFVGLQLADEAALQTSVIDPRDQTQESCRIESRGDETIEIAGQQVVVRHLVLTSADGSVRHVWLDGVRVMRVEVPAEGFVAVRSDAAEPSTNSSRG